MVCSDFTVLQLSQISAVLIYLTARATGGEVTQCYVGDSLDMWIRLKNDSPTAGVADCVLTITGPTTETSSVTPFQVMVAGATEMDYDPIYWTPAAAGVYTICVEIRGQQPA